MMNILIAGGTGFVGSALTSKLIEQNNNVFIVTRYPQHYSNSSHVTYINYDTHTATLPKMDAVINLAGESLFGRWTTNKKERIINSRLQTTNRIIEMMAQFDQKPDVF